MRPALFVTFVAILGCAKPAPPPPTVAAPPVPTAAAPREADEQAAYALDAAGASIEEALAGTKALAAKAEDAAKAALLDVADGLEAAGAALADHEEPPPADRPFTDAERKATREAAQEALEGLRDAGKVLDDLAQNAPKEFEAPLETIRTAVDEATDGVKEAARELGSP